MDMQSALSERSTPARQSSSFLSRLRRSAVGAVQSTQRAVSTQHVSLGLQTVSLVANGAASDDAQIDSCHL